MADRVFLPRSLGVPAEGVKDQYADGRAARGYNKFIGDHKQRTRYYKDFLVGLLRKHNCVTVLDVACGTGIDSILLVEEGFKVVSVDASDKMLKQALKARWEKRKDPRFNEWVIEEACWETLPRDLEAFLPDIKFDALICLGNSFAHLLDEFGDQRVQAMCLRNFAACLKPGGLFFIDHRNYDAMIDNGAAPGHSIYYNCQYPVDIKTSLVVVSGKPEIITLDYFIDTTDTDMSDFRLCYYPHRVKKFTSMLDSAFGEGAQRQTYADFKPLDAVANPGFYIHVMNKPKY